VTALCRCGASAKKPYCDGTHKGNGFSGTRVSDGSTDRREDYVGKDITIHDNRGVCSHAGTCTEGLPSVFREDDEPWIDPNGADASKVIDLIRKCPSGALRYSVKGLDGGDQDRQSMITVTKDGPYALTGGVTLEGEQLMKGSSSEHCTLCRCGNSENKPFCDGTHWDVGFKDDRN
jgi:CDGSH-type Zn-finger protein